MTDRFDPKTRSQLMAKIKGKDTKPEKVVRSLLHRLGYRFRLYRKDLPGTPDIVFPSRKLVLFVHGCFWHGHGCHLGKLPKSHLDYWEPKIKANIARDERKKSELIEKGWHVFIIWQCELSDPDNLTRRLLAILNSY